MGENLKEQHSAADTLREQIRHTESDITETVQNLEERLSPRFLRKRGVREAKHLLWKGTEKTLAFLQRSSVQASVIGGSALLPLMLLFGKRTPRHSVLHKIAAVPEPHRASTAAKAVGAGGGLLMLLRKAKERDLVPVSPPISGLALAATVAKSFLTGARSSKKSGTTQPGRKVAWRGIATAIGAALGSYWYSHRGHRV